MGRLLAERSIGVIYGGGRVGLMGVLADSASEAGGEVIGVIPQSLAEREVAHPGLSELHVVESMHDRKALMAELAAGFIALPGGFGTMEEFCEIVTWSQLGFHRKPCGLLNVAGYFDSLIAMFDRGLADGFISEANRAIVLEASVPQEIVELVLSTALRTI